jgi:hypothetical protein
LYYSCKLLTRLDFYFLFLLNLLASHYLNCAFGIYTKINCDIPKTLTSWPRIEAEVDDFSWRSKVIVLVDFYYCVKPYNLLGGSLPVNWTSNIVKIRTLVIPNSVPIVRQKQQLRYRWGGATILLFHRIRQQVGPLHWYVAT